MNAFNEWLYPELKRLPARADQRAAMWAYQPRIFGSWKFWVFFAFAIPIGVSMPMLVQYANQFVPGSLFGGGVSAIIGGLLKGILFGLGFNYLFRKPTRRFLREYLNERGHRLCLDCGYDLRGQTIARCPECGSAFDAARLSKSPPDAD